MLANRTFFGLTSSVYQAELPAHGSRSFLVCLLSLVCGAAAGTFTPCWGGLNPASRLQWPRLSRAFQACTLPSYVTAATCRALCLPEYVSFQTGWDEEELVSACLDHVFRVFLVSFVTSIYPFLPNRVRIFSTNMAEEGSKRARFVAGACCGHRKILAKAL